ncbi:MAG TPA: lectin [Streptosporangiaceae bacterium]|nr:lectin [Streptosporangiaceae bacterium]
MAFTYPHYAKPLTLLAAAMAAIGLIALPSVPIAAAAVTDPASVVNPFIGTTNGGDTFPGADAPFGMVQWSPDTPSRPSGGGYSYNDSSITGFSLTHLSGPGCGAEGDVPVLPTTGTVNTSATDGFSHSGESANAGFYSVALSNGITTQLTATARTGMAQFTFPATSQANLIFKLNGSANGDSATTFTVVSSTEVSGSVTSGGFCGAGNSYTAYFDARFSQPFSTNGTFTPVGSQPGARHLATTAPGSTAQAEVPASTPEQPNHPVYHGPPPPGRHQAATLAGPNGGYLTFNTTSNHVVDMTVGLSYVSVANASANLTAENNGFNFSTVQTATHNAWNAMLGRIQITGGTATQQANFYTALYHALLHPNVNSDTNGQYQGTDGKVHTVDSGHTAEYTNFSGWDIYRAQSQLEALLDPVAASDTAQSMIDDYAQGAMLPKWMENNGESYVMVGDPADPILADYYAFGARNFATSTALSDMVNEATVASNIRPGLNYLESIGYEPANGSYGCCNFYGPTSTTLEYNTADFAIAAFAGALGNSADQTTFQNRAQDWQNVFNPATGFMEGRNVNGSWESGFNSQSGSDANFVEATPYIYTGMVPFNVAGLTTAMGGVAKMNSYLNNVLSSFTGANGFAWMGNEPSIELPWEYDYTGEPYQAQHVVREIQDQIWTDTPSGLADGNDDLGTMSAWYVWSALGMYPETPGTADLALGSPLFTQATVSLGDGNTLTINGTGAADNAPYVQSATWNGAAWNNAYAPTAAITSGGTLSFTLGTSANTSWASAASAAPPSYGGTAPAGTGYNNTGIGNDGSAGASFDSSGNAYSAQALSAAGVNPGSQVTSAGSTFTWPNVGAGTPDNYLADGQTIKMSGSGSIAFLGASTNGPSTGTATVTFTDGSTQSVTVAFSDWTLNGGSASVMSGNTLAITTPYRDNSSGGKETVTTDVFATSPVSLPSGKTIASVTLPGSANQGFIHVFAIAAGASASAPTGPIVAGVSSSLCVDDRSSSTANSNPIQVYTCNNTGAQQWTVAANGTLQVLGGCMDVTHSGTADGTLVQFYQCNGTGAQQWAAQSNGEVVNPESGKCLDDPGSATTPGTQLDIATCTGASEQVWHLP